MSTAGANTPSRKPANQLTDGRSDKRGSATQKKRPEAVRYLLNVWLVAAGAEAIHQILQIAIAWSNREVLVAELTKALKEQETTLPLTQNMLDVAANASIFGSSFIYVFILALLLFLLTRLAKGGKWAANARRVWFAFSIYFAFRVLMVFLMSPAGSKVPDWLYVADAAVQIIVGTAAVMGLLFSSKEETLEYTGEMEQLRKLEAEAAAEKAAERAAAKKAAAEQAAAEKEESDD